MDCDGARMLSDFCSLVIRVSLEVRVMLECSELCRMVLCFKSTGYLDSWTITLRSGFQISTFSVYF